MEEKKPLSITDIIRLRQAREESGTIGNQDTTIVEETTTTDNKEVEAVPTPKVAQNVKATIKHGGGKTGDLNLKSSDVAKDTDIVVAGRRIVVTEEQMKEFLIRTSGNNSLGELTEEDKRIVKNLDLGVHVGSADDKESITLGQDAIAGIITNAKKKEQTTGTLANKLEEERRPLPDIASPKEENEEEQYVSPTVTSTLPPADDEDEDENKYNLDSDKEAEIVTIPKPKKGVIIEDEDTDTPKDEEVERIETFKTNNSGVAEITANKIDFDDKLNSIKIVPFNGKKIIRQRKTNKINSKKTPICALSSNIYAEMTGFSYSDLTQLNGDKTDGYLDRKRQLEILYSKIVNPNVPLSFDLFLRATSIYDEEAFYFGAFKSTFGDTINIPLTCQDPECKHSFTYGVDVDDLIISKDYISMGDKVKEIMSMSSLKDVESSDVNKIHRFRLESGHIVDIRHPSLYTLLERTIKLVSNSSLANEPKYSNIIDLLPFIGALYVPVLDPEDTRNPNEVSPEELNFVEISIDDGDKVKDARIKLQALCDELLTLDYSGVIQISKFIMDRVNSVKDQFTMGIVDVVCPKCGKPLGAPSQGFTNFIPISIRELIFLNQLHQINAISTK